MWVSQEMEVGTVGVERQQGGEGGELKTAVAGFWYYLGQEHLDEIDGTVGLFDVESKCLIEGQSQENSEKGHPT